MRPQTSDRTASISPSHSPFQWEVVLRLVLPGLYPCDQHLDALLDRLEHAS
ncbi:hypothetical protein [Actibacterium sp. 188UL27-1]|uniref:hypothetical protein n=1 Tax=Actibacterium sp. 188UL27-1 TaxID=2786961 RepID=UPI00195CBBAE|nr:hypothetical protein [Actibacterium sp. 188UL27-1]MBM7067255.1 hypothetical protein [Actibacterium sp. 188UL27-1]